MQKMSTTSNDSQQSLSSNDECTIKLAIQINDNQAEILIINTNDNIEEKVKGFCHLHELSSNINQKIINQITDQIEESINNSKYFILRYYS